MIWNAESSPDGDVSTLTSFLVSEIRVACEDGVVDEHRAREVAGAVAEYCSVDLGMQTLPTDCLGLFLSRSLSSVGEDEAAERVMKHFGLSKEESVTARMLPVVGKDASWVWMATTSRMIRTSCWAVSSAERMWVLDLRSVEWREHERVELVMLRELRCLLDGLAEVWDATSGAGWIGVRGLSTQAAEVMNRSERDRRTVGFAREMLTFCRDRCAGLQRERGWHQAPVVLNLDI